MLKQLGTPLLALAIVHRPAWEAVLEHILSQRVIGLDQTSWPRLETGKSKRSGHTPWQMWGLTVPNAAYYAIRDDKSTATALDILEGFDGVANRGRVRMDLMSGLPV